MRFWNRLVKRSNKLSIVVVFHNMVREAERTLYSLGCHYQSGVNAEDYEVIAIDNGSERPLAEDRVREFGSNFTYRFYPTESVSPARAVNFGVGLAKGNSVAVIVDGARMVTPGLIRESLRALNTLTTPFVCALGWHLGPKVQNLSMLDGYDQAEEDRLLEAIDWKNNGYRLFEVSTLALSSSIGFLGGMPKECSWFAMPRSDFIRIGGFDERFQAPGGGLVNHEFLNRVLSRPETAPVVILGEGSFHQVHGGVATNTTLEQHPWKDFGDEYARIYQRAYQDVGPTPAIYMGKMHDLARRFISPVS